MTVKKKTDEQQELEMKQEEERVTEAAELLDRSIEEDYSEYSKEQKARYKNSIEKLKQLDTAMIDKALRLLEVAGDGVSDPQIKQIEKAIEIYQVVKYL